MGPSEFALEKPHFLVFSPVFGEPLILSVLHLRLARNSPGMLYKSVDDACEAC